MARDLLGRMIHDGVTAIERDFSDDPVTQLERLGATEGYLTGTLESGAVVMGPKQRQELYDRIHHSIRMARYRIGQASRAGVLQESRNLPSYPQNDERPMGVQQAEKPSKRSNLRDSQR